MGIWPNGDILFVAYSCFFPPRHSSDGILTYMNEETLGKAWKRKRDRKIDKAQKRDILHNILLCMVLQHPLVAT